MKKVTKICAVIFSLFLSSALCFSEDSSEVDWNQVGQSGKEALKQTGNFFKTLGNKIGNDVHNAVEDAKEVKCAGTWYFNNKNTIIKINDDFTMEITQKESSDTHFYRGTYTNALNILKFTITEEGTKSWKAVKSENTTQKPKKWTITYSVQDDGSVMFMSSSIPKDIDGNSFTNGQLFTAK